MTLIILQPPTNDCCEMADWRISLQHSRSVVNRAGRTLKAGPASRVEYDVVNNWRGAHGVPMNAIQADLRIAARKIQPNCLLAQRLKRLRSIREKLQRTTLTLTQIQDIGGCRAVLLKESKARDLYNRYLESQRIGHVCWGKNDYVTSPALTGYRSFHLKYKYHSNKEENASYNGMRVEIQIRSRLQHIWATAVEMVGAIRDEPLKSGLGNSDWLRLFQLVGSVMAEREGTAPVPNTPTKHKELIDELHHYERTLDAINMLTGYTAGMRAQSKGPRPTKRHYFIMELDKKERKTTIRRYTIRQLHRALEEFGQLEFELEANHMDKDIVLVAADSLQALRRAYPNYHLDTRLFVEIMRGALA